MGLAMEESKLREGRRLSSKNNKQKDNYITAMLGTLEAHNVLKQVEGLHKKDLGGTLDEADVKEYNKLDEWITAAMLSAEKNYPNKEIAYGPKS